MKFKKLLVWSLINGRPHRLFTSEEKRPRTAEGIVSALFPGIDYPSKGDFQVVLQHCAVPVLKKLFSELKSVPEDDITAEMTVDITEFLPSNKYEWKGSLRWRAKLKKLLATK